MMLEEDPLADISDDEKSSSKSIGDDPLAATASFKRNMEKGQKREGSEMSKGDSCEN